MELGLIGDQFKEILFLGNELSLKELNFALEHNSAFSQHFWEIKIIKALRDGDSPLKVHQFDILFGVVPRQFVFVHDLSGGDSNYGDIAVLFFREVHTEQLQQTDVH